MQKFYFHDAATTDTGTLPGAGSQSATTPDVTATGAATNRAMDSTIGTSQVGIAVTSIARTTIQRHWYRRWCSPPLAATTIATGAWSIHIGSQESNTNAKLLVVGRTAYIWRPSTGALVGRIFDNAADFYNNASTAEEAAIVPVIAGSTTAVTLQDGDILVFEAWDSCTQGMSTAYTDTYYYDGTTEDSTTTNAAYLLAPVDLALFTASTVLPPLPTVVGQAVERSYNW